MAPPAIQLSCATPLDDIRYVGMFMSLGVYFAGISVGSSTFGDEKGTSSLLSSIVPPFFFCSNNNGERLIRLAISFFSCVCECSRVLARYLGRYADSPLLPGQDPSRCAAHDRRR